VANATGSKYSAGISNVGRVKNLRIRDCHLHHINGPVARFAGEGIILEGNDIHDGVLGNSSNQPMSGWPTCIGTQPDKDTPADPWAKNIIVRKNQIRDCWGEGIALFFGTNGVVEDNIVDRVWGAGIYLDNASDVTVSRNYVHMVAGMSVGGGPGRPLALGLENYDQWGVAYKPMLNITITNNVAIGQNGLRFAVENSTSPNFYYDNLTLAHNTFIAEGPALRMNPLQMGKQLPTKVSIHNNVMIEGAATTVPYPEVFDFAGNAWLNEALPPAAGPTDVSLMNVTLPANVTAATDLQSLAETVGSAAMPAGVPIDYLCAPRSATTPTRGPFEK
jgi:parallel beta-helix repeat protein